MQHVGAGSHGHMMMQPFHKKVLARATKKGAEPCRPRLLPDTLCTLGPLQSRVVLLDVIALGGIRRVVTTAKGALKLMGHVPTTRLMMLESPQTVETLVARGALVGLHPEIRSHDFFLDVSSSVALLTSATSAASISSCSSRILLVAALDLQHSP